MWQTKYTNRFKETQTLSAWVYSQHETNVEFYRVFGLYNFTMWLDLPNQFLLKHQNVVCLWSESLHHERIRAYMYKDCQSSGKRGHVDWSQHACWQKKHVDMLWFSCWGKRGHVDWSQHACWQKKHVDMLWFSCWEFKTCWHDIKHMSTWFDFHVENSSHVDMTSNTCQHVWYFDMHGMQCWHVFMCTLTCLLMHVNIRQRHVAQVMTCRLVLVNVPRWLGPMHTVTSFIHQSELSPLSFSANLLTIFIPSCVLPHLIYHICNLYRGLPLPSPSLVSASADGFFRTTLSRPFGPMHGFTGHLNSAAGPSMWSMSTT